MNLSDKHPAEIDFRNMFTEVQELIEKYENKYVDGEEKLYLKSELKKINQSLFDLQMERFTQYINDRGKVENLPKDEEILQREMTDLGIRINEIIEGWHN